MPTHVVGLTFKTDAGSVPISSVPFIVDTEINEDILVPAGTTKQVDVPFAFARVNDYCLTLLNAVTKAEATVGEVIVDWDTAGAGTPRMDVVAKKPIWHAPGFGTTNLFTADVTTVYMQNTGTADLRVAVHIGLNDVV